MRLASLAPLALVLMLVGCNDRAPIETELQTIRSYGWEASAVDPEPDWNPESYQLVARSTGGFALLEEGGKGEQVFASEERRESHYPRWINRSQFVFGPSVNAVRQPDGRVLHPSDGLTVVTINEGRPTRRILCDRGFMPMPAGNLIWAQALERIISIDTRGNVSELEDGFEPVPQPGGPGLCWRDIPTFTPDYWTGRESQGILHIRWKPGTVDDIQRATQAVWTRDGGVLATVIDTPAATGKPWWSGSTRIVGIDGPGLPQRDVRTGAHDPSPHPKADLLAWTKDDGSLWIGTLRPDGWQLRITENGYRPRWSNDGLRLCWLEPQTGKQNPMIRVAVLAPKR